MKRKAITDQLSREFRKLALDMDLLVLFNQPEVCYADEDKIFDVTYPIELETGIPINPFITTKTQWESRMTPFRLNVINDGVRL